GFEVRAGAGDFRRRNLRDERAGADGVQHAMVQEFLRAQEVDVVRGHERQAEVLREAQGFAEVAGGAATPGCAPIRKTRRQECLRHRPRWRGATEMLCLEIERGAENVFQPRDALLFVHRTIVEFRFLNFVFLVRGIEGDQSFTVRGEFVEADRAVLEVPQGDQAAEVRVADSVCGQQEQRVVFHIESRADDRLHACRAGGLIERYGAVQAVRVCERHSGGVRGRGGVHQFLRRGYSPQEGIVAVTVEMDEHRNRKTNY